MYWKGRDGGLIKRLEETFGGGGQNFEYQRIKQPIIALAMINLSHFFEVGQHSVLNCPKSFHGIMKLFEFKCSFLSKIKRQTMTVLSCGRTRP